jgi:DNA-binding transcriptional ArsR family regulator
MAENKESSDEKLLILPLGNESKKITQVISNDTARQIIELLADSALSASDISERLHAPLTTITYNLENLENVGLIKVERIKYSEKGREVKIYAPVRKLIVIVPEKTEKKSVADLLNKYLGIILASVLASSLIEFFIRQKSSTMIAAMDMSLNQEAQSSVPLSNATADALMNGTAILSEGQKTLVANATPELPMATQPQIVTSTPIPMLKTGAEPDIISIVTGWIFTHPGLLFLIGCLFVILLVIMIEYFRNRKNS